MKTNIRYPHHTSQITNLHHCLSGADLKGGTGCSGGVTCFQRGVFLEPTLPVGRLGAAFTVHKVHKGLSLSPHTITQQGGVGESHARRPHQRVMHRTNTTYPPREGERVNSTESRYGNEIFTYTPMIGRDLTKGSECINKTSFLDASIVT